MKKDYVKVPIWWLNLGIGATLTLLFASVIVRLWLLTAFSIGELMVVLRLRYGRIQ